MDYNKNKLKLLDDNLSNNDIIYLINSNLNKYNCFQIAEIYLNSFFHIDYGLFKYFIIRLEKEKDEQYDILLGIICDIIKKEKISKNKLKLAKKVLKNKMLNCLISTNGNKDRCQI